jgi:glutathione S-transferase
VTAFDLGRVAKIRIPEALSNLTAWYARVSERPSVAATSPARKSR